MRLSRAGQRSLRSRSGGAVGGGGRRADLEHERAGAGGAERRATNVGPDADRHGGATGGHAPDDARKAPGPAGDELRVGDDATRPVAGLLAPKLDAQPDALVVSAAPSPAANSDHGVV